MVQAFISYSHDDSVFAERLAHDLKDAGLDVWIDLRSIAYGSEWQKRIFDGIAESTLVLVCLTPAAVRSAWVVCRQTKWDRKRETFYKQFKSETTEETAISLTPLKCPGGLDDIH
jgi:hypothetical protein